MTLDEVIKALQQASKDTGWGDKDVDIFLRHNDQSLEVFKAPPDVVIVREEFPDYPYKDQGFSWTSSKK